MVQPSASNTKHKPMAQFEGVTVVRAATCQEFDLGLLRNSIATYSMSDLKVVVPIDASD